VGLSFLKTGDEMRNKNKNSAEEKAGDQTSFLTSIGPWRSFTFGFEFALPAP